MLIRDLLKGVLSPTREKTEPRRLLPPPRQSGYVKSFDGTEIYWEMHGPEPKSVSDRPMVFCYGLACSMNQWRLQIERYSGCHPCLLVDYRGHHKSSSPENSTSMNLSALAKDVAAAIQFQKFSKAPHIWGHSLGVSTALELALAHPEMCHSLVLCCGSVDNPFEHMFNGRWINLIFKPVKDNYTKRPEVFNRIWDLLLSRPEITRKVVRYAGFNPFTTSLVDIETYVEAVKAIDARVFFPLAIELSKGLPPGLLKKIKIPAFVVAGTHDLITPLSTQKEMARILPKATLIEIPAGSHNVQLDFGEYVGMKIEEAWRQKKLW